MDAIDEAGERAAQNRRRHRALAVQIKRALITAANGVQQWLDDDPDKDGPDIIPGDSRLVQRSGNRPPFVPREPVVPRDPDDTAEFRAADRLMREAPDPNGRRDRPARTHR